MPERMENAVTLCRCLDCGAISWTEQDFRDNDGCIERGRPHGPTQDVDYVPASSATDETHLPETGEQSSGEDDPIQRQHEWLERIPNPARSSHEGIRNAED